MGVVVASELHSCAGRPLSSAGPATANPQAQPQVSDEEAATDAFIPAEGISAVLVSPHRVLVTGGTLADDRVLPFTVVRFLDLDPSPAAAHAWTKPLLLRPTSKRGKRKRNGHDSAFPVCRMEHTLTLVPDSAALYLIGGLKVGGKDEGNPCKSMFSFDIKTRLWNSVDLELPPSKVKVDSEQSLGPRFAHSALHVPHLRSESRAKARKSSGYILAYGGYTACDDRAPSSHIHFFDVRARRWALRTPERGISAPSRAYHAAAITASSRYFVVHSGNCADFFDTFFLSPDLYVFDIDQSEWFQPALLSSSAEPPSARRRHSMVNGVGKHEGALILFGGHLSNGTFSNELFVLRIVEPTALGQAVAAVWEKFDVRSPENPLPLERLAPQQHQEQPPPERTTSTAVAGGSLLAVPALEKYLFLGGRGAYGFRNSPLLLDASEAEQLDRFEGPSSRELDQPVSSGGPGARVIVRVKGNKTAIGPRARRPSSPGGRADSKSDDEINPCPRELSRTKPPRPASLQNPDLQAAAGPHVSSLQPTESDKSPSLKPTRLPASNATESKGARKSNGFALEAQPATSVRPVSAVAVGRRQTCKPSGDIVANVHEVNEDDDDDFILPRIEDKPDSQDLETPPTKRRRFISGNYRKELPNFGLDDGIITDSDNDDIPDSSGSDFVAASELARRGKSRTTKASRGRGRCRPRGRAMGQARARAATVADAREAVKEREAEEALNRENARLVKQLQADNDKLRGEKDVINKDNQDLNDQMRGLLAEVQGLRALRKVQPMLDTGSPPTPKEMKSLDSSQAARGTHEDAEVSRLAPEHKSKQSGSEERKVLLSKISDLQEECHDMSTEKEGLRKSLKELEEARRGVETELNVTRNKLERMDTERDTFRRQASELRAIATTANARAEDAVSQVRREEERNATLKRELESLRSEVRDLNAKRREYNFQLSSAQRHSTTVRAQLLDAQKKYEEFDAKERLLKAEVSSRQEKVEELTKLVAEGNVSKQRMEEKNIELVTELETLKSDFAKKLKECETAIKDAEKSRESLDRQRNSAAELDIEATRLRRELERERKERKNLMTFVKKRDASLQALRPALARITSEIGALTSSPEEEDVGHLLVGLSEAEGGGPDDVAIDPAEERQGQVCGRAPEGQGGHGVQATEKQQPGDDTQNKERADCLRQEGEIRGGNDAKGNGAVAKSPISASDDADEP